MVPRHSRRRRRGCVSPGGQSANAASVVVRGLHAGIPRLDPSIDDVAALALTLTIATAEPDDSLVSPVLLLDLG